MLVLHNDYSQSVRKSPAFNKPQDPVLSQFSRVPNFTSRFCKIRFHILEFTRRFPHAASSCVDRQVYGLFNDKDSRQDTD